MPINSTIAKLESDFLKNGGQWREFKIDELFKKKTIKGVPKQQENLTPNPNGYHIFGQNIKYQYPQKVLLDEKFLNRVKADEPILAYTSSVGEIGMIAEDFYRSGDNGAFQGLFPKFQNYNKRHILFILAILQKQFSHFGYATGMGDILNLKLSIPFHSGEIAFEFMENYIRALENERVLELEIQQKLELQAYLKVTGLENYELNEDEKAALKAFEATLNERERERE